MRRSAAPNPYHPSKIKSLRRSSPLPIRFGARSTSIPKGHHERRSGPIGPAPAIRTLRSAHPSSGATTHRLVAFAGSGAGFVGEHGSSTADDRVPVGDWRTSSLGIKCRPLGSTRARLKSPSVISLGVLNILARPTSGMCAPASTRARATARTLTGESSSLPLGSPGWPELSLGSAHAGPEHRLHKRLARLVIASSLVACRRGRPYARQAYPFGRRR